MGREIVLSCSTCGNRFASDLVGRTSGNCCGLDELDGSGVVVWERRGSVMFLLLIVFHNFFGSSFVPDQIWLVVREEGLLWF